MQVEVDRIEANKLRLRLSLEKEQVAEAFKQANRKLAKTIKLDGFRPGRAPRQVVERAVGRENLAREALETLIPTAYAQALREKKLVPIDYPQIEEASLPVEGEPFSFSAVVETKPEVELGEYRGLRLKKEVVSVKAEEEEAALKEVQEQKAILAPKDEPAELGDVAELSFQGFQGGRKLSDFQGETTAELGSSTLLQEIEQGVLGMRVGEKKRVSVVLDERSPMEKYRGQEVVVDVHLKECKKKTLPEINELLAQSLGYDSLEDLRKAIRQNLLNHLARRERDKVFSQLVQQAAEHAKVEIPATLVKREMERMLQEMDANLRTYGLKVEDYIENGKLKDPSRQKEMEETAARKVKMDLTLEAIAKKEGLKVTEEEFGREVVALAQELKKDPKFVLEQLRETGEDRSIIAQVLRVKTMEFLLEHAVVQMVPQKESEEEQ